jgi:hypothetical protein
LSNPIDMPLGVIAYVAQQPNITQTACLSRHLERKQRLLQLVGDYLGGNFTMQSEKPLIDEIISLVSPTLSMDDVFEVIFEGDIETSAQGVAALRAFAQTK